jgi:hypothetical protein
MAPQMMELHERMMRDPVIRERVMADTAMRRMMQRSTSAPKKAVPAKKVTPAKKPAPAKAAPPKSPPMDHSRMPGMNP